LVEHAGGFFVKGRKERLEAGQFFDEWDRVEKSTRAQGNFPLSPRRLGLKALSVGKATSGRRRKQGQEEQRNQK